MTDTARTLSALQTLLADNTAEAISPQDLRDMLVSVMGGYGAAYAAADASAQSSIGTSLTKLTAWADSVTTSKQCTPSASTEDITVTVAGIWLAVTALSFSGSTNTTFQVRFHVDDVDSGMGFERKIGAGGDVGTAIGLAILNLSAGTEVVDLFIKADGSSKSVTVHIGSTLALIRLA